MAKKTEGKIRLGFIGCGRIAHKHMKGLINQSDVEIVAGVDIIPGKAKAFFEEFGLKGVKTDYADHKALLADKSLKLDAVTICTYNTQHAPCAIDALNAGLHVLLEKPFTVTTEEALAVMRAERASGKILSIGFQPRFDENAKILKDVVDSGILGKIYYIQVDGGRRRGIPVAPDDSFLKQSTAGVGALGDLGCYALDLALHAVGYPKPLTATGFKSSYFGTDPNYSVYRERNRTHYADVFDVEDFAAGFVRLEGDIALDFRISWAMNMDKPNDTIILGTKAGLRIPVGPQWLGIVGGPMTLYQEVCGQQVETTIPFVEGITGEMKFERKIRAFLDAVKVGGSAPVSTSEILYNQAILDALSRSAELGREVEIDLPEI